MSPKLRRTLTLTVSVLIREKRRRHRDIQEGHVKMEEEMGAMQLKAKKH